MLKTHITVLNRCFHTTCTLNALPGKFLRKIMGTTKKKRFYEVCDNPVLPSTGTVFGKSSFETKVTGNPRRSNMLNKIFMRHITDIMATGEYSKEVLGFGIEVNKIKVSPDYKFLRVYWIANESGKHDEIEKLLKMTAGHLRHELSTLRVMGQVPPIVFVKDKNYCKISEVQERLKKADFGEDYEPPDLVEQYKSSELEILTSFDTTVKAKLEKLDKLESEVDTGTSDALGEIPPMPQNVLGLNHADILKRVKKLISLSEASHRSTESSEWAQWSEFKTTQPVNQDPVTFGNHHEQRKTFKEFFLQRQILKLKQHRMDKNWTADMDYIKDEWREKQQKNLLAEEGEEIDEEDYLIEDIEQNGDVDSQYK